MLRVKQRKERGFEMTQETKRFKCGYCPFRYYVRSLYHCEIAHGRVVGYNESCKDDDKRVRMAFKALGINHVDVDKARAILAELEGGTDTHTHHPTDTTELDSARIHAAEMGIELD
jgi:hypothetical protein